MTKPWKPTPKQIADARGKTIRDVIGPGLSLLFVGINPSLYSAAVGHHFARPGNRFWPTLHQAGLTPRLFSPFEDRQLLQLGMGLTNLAGKATARADELSPEELTRGANRLLRKLACYRPRWVAFLGVTAYRTAFARPLAPLGPQEETLAGARVWTLPSPSGLNAHYRLAELSRLYAELRRAALPQPHEKEG
jgi:TDG/mug DNA glycosylase family protein